MARRLGLSQCSRTCTAVLRISTIVNGKASVYLDLQRLPVSRVPQFREKEKAVFQEPVILTRLKVEHNVSAPEEDEAQVVG